MTSPLRDLHVPGHPLVLANAWDAWSARLVEQAGFEAVATSSAAVARSLGSEDHELLGVEEALAAAGRVVDAVSVPVTVDFESGYGLEPEQIAYGLLGAGAAGCNLEDSDLSRPGELRSVADAAARIAGVRAAAGDRFVINARVDTFALRRSDALAEAIERGKAYLDAGADCIYPIAVAAESDIAALVDALGVVNALLFPPSPSLARLAELGVARVSVGSGLFATMTSQVSAVLGALRDGDDSSFRGG